MSFRTIFGQNRVMLARCEAALAGGSDPHPDSSNSPALEAVMRALFAKRALPPEADQLIAPVALAAEELFVMRDRGAVS